MGHPVDTVRGAAGPGLRVAPARDARSHRAVQELFVRYGEEWHHELGAQDVCAEAQWTVEDYAPPENGLLVAWLDDEAVGCVGFRAGDGFCEMKRMYVVPEARGRGVGRALAEAVLAAAREAGHRAIRLDTTEGMGAARRLYTALGFEERTPYYDSPCRSPVFMERRL